MLRNQLISDVKKALGSDVQFQHRYYAWTGDKGNNSDCLPGNSEWLDGSKHIRADWPELLRSAPNRKIVIVGWSNGAATAYELACSISKLGSERVSLLVTLDPVSRLTEPTDYCLRENGTLIRPARMWIGVYTRSSGLDAITETGNIIAWVGKAWNDTYPTGLNNQARPLMKLYPANHGDVSRMWNECVMPSKAFMDWASTHGDRSDQGFPSRAACLKQQREPSRASKAR